MEKNIKWWQKEVTWGFFIKFMVTVNIVILYICLECAYVGDILTNAELEYMTYLEEKVSIQDRLIEAYSKLLNGGIRDVKF